MRTVKVIVVIVACVGFCLASPLHAQVPTPIECGNTIESVITQDRQIQKYHITLERGTKLIVHAASVGIYEDLTLDIGLIAPNEYEISRLDYDNEKEETIETEPLSTAGAYELSVRGYTDTGGAYKISVSCITATGEVISDTNMVQSANCGAFIDNEVARDRELHRYFIHLSRGDHFKVRVVSLASAYESLTLDIGLVAPNDFVISRLDYDNEKEETIETDALSVSGTYKLYVRSYTNTTGSYNVAITCVLADGTVVNPGDTQTISANPSESSQDAVSSEANVQFGFPGLASVNFGQGVTIPLNFGTPNTGSISPGFEGIFGFTFTANAGDIMDLGFTRMSGNLNLGFAVLSSDNQVAFQASLVTSNVLSTQFNVPATGDYTIGVYPISLIPPDAPETTTFQISGTLNP